MKTVTPQEAMAGIRIATAPSSISRMPAPMYNPQLTDRTDFWSISGSMSDTLATHQAPWATGRKMTIPIAGTRARGGVPPADAGRVNGSFRGGVTGQPTGFWSR